jgi:hypothetical protein
VYEYILLAADILFLHHVVCTDVSPLKNVKQITKGRDVVNLTIAIYFHEEHVISRHNTLYVANVLASKHVQPRD